MATLASLTLDVLDMIYGQAQVTRPIEDTLATEVTNAADVTWQFTSDELWKRGDYAEWFDGTGAAKEIVYFTTDHPSAADVTVRRAQRRTSAQAAAIPVGTVFQKNPPYSHTEIQRAITEVIDNDLHIHVWYRSKRSFTPIVDRHYYDLTAADYQIEEMYQFDVGGVNDLGFTWTFDETGGALEDLWTSSAAHGLSVGEHCQFPTAGTNATGYAIDTDYWVVAVPSTTTLTLAATKAGTAVSGAGDGVGWSLGRIVPEYVPFPSGYWEPITEQTNDVSSTGRILRVHQWRSNDHDVFYTTRTKPTAAAVADLPTEISDMVPWGAVARLVGGTAVRERHDSTRSFARRQGVSASQPYADAEFFRVRFEEMKNQYRRQLVREKFAARRLHRGVVGASTFFTGQRRRGRSG